MTQGKIERYHRSMKNTLPHENYYSPDELTDQIDLFIEYYNNHRCRAFGAAEIFSAIISPLPGPYAGKNSAQLGIIMKR